MHKRRFTQNRETSIDILCDQIYNTIDPICAVSDCDPPILLKKRWGCNVIVLQPMRGVFRLRRLPHLPVNGRLVPQPMLPWEMEPLWDFQRRVEEGDIDSIRL